MWVVVGLGNPGIRYSQTRHNTGFIFIKRVAREWKVKLRKRSYLVKTGEFKKSKERTLLVLPLTFMNKSGLAVKDVLEETKASPEKLVIVYDDLDIPLGEIRVRKEGNAGTHKGMNSVIEELQATNFPRIRVGIGPLLSGKDATQYVLSLFNKEEKLLLNKSLKIAQEALEMILAGETERAMNKYNIRVKPSLQ